MNKTVMIESKEFENLFLKVVLHDDEKAFKILFHEFYSAMCVYCDRIVDNMEDAEDIVQDTFYKIWKNRKRIEITTSFRNFLITGVKNGALDFLRKKDLSHRYAKKQSMSYDTSKTPEDFYTFNELQSKISEVLDKLPPRMREMFEMNRFKGMTYNEIATQMSVSPKTVESDMSKALKILRMELKEYLPLLILFSLNL